ncbi:hypothetical protein PUN28_018275 [Cardiocondyla obscurior]|uniref:Secreted protein n=1 Tax=Cardiocondyla obscurior TaxID=286306 RepID=A0AAW2EGN3_9HYME
MPRVFFFFFLLYLILQRKVSILRAIIRNSLISELMFLCRFVCAKALTRGGGGGGGGDGGSSHGNGERSTISQIEMVPGAPFFAAFNRNTRSVYPRVRSPLDKKRNWRVQTARKYCSVSARENLLLRLATRGGESGGRRNRESPRRRRKRRRENRSADDEESERNPVPG